MSTWRVRSDFVEAEVQSLGAMLGPARFRVGDLDVQPFAIAPWSDDTGPRHESLPKILQRLRGEWPCVPYGIECSDIASLPPDWRTRDAPATPAVSHPHGWSSNAEWQLGEISDTRIELVLEYPALHPVKRVIRVIQASCAQPRLDMQLRIEVREACALPIGLHPTLRVPATPRRARLDLGPRARAWTSPVPLESRIARVRSDARGVPLQEIPTLDGVEDITALPLPYTAEEIVLTGGHDGRATLDNLDEHYSLTLSWDARVFPACQLWLSNGGRTDYPWNGQFRALAIEPICGAFDLGTAVSANRANPLWQAGIPCTIALSPERNFETAYSVEVTELPAGTADAIRISPS